VSAALPFILEQATSFEAYGTATVDSLYGERLKRAQRLEVNTLASVALLNRGDHFEARPLPREAQWAPAFGVSVADFDGDGNEDVFLSQNFFALAPDYPRLDAGRGLWLRGDGQGGLRAVSGQDSGVKAYGEQRGCAGGDFDHDGRVDLVVTQNGAATRLFRNTRAKPGLRVVLNGPPGNLPAFGARLRLGDGTRWGPTREVHGGGGYWSLDAPAPVLTFAGEPRLVEVRWPGGRTSQADVPPGAREMKLRWDEAAPAPAGR
jgi:hypothetical protein